MFLLAGFPGDVRVSVTYTLVEPYTLLLEMNAKALNRATPINLAQHTYWNLGGHNSGDILSDKLQMFASSITPVLRGIPTGQIESIAGTAYDFLEPQVIGCKIKELNGSAGFDNNYVVDAPSEEPNMSPVAVVYNEKSGRVMKLSATAPGVQLYTGNWLDKIGKCGYKYQRHAGLCLETQGFPDSVNHPNFPSQIVKAGHVYEHKMLYEFSTK